MTTSANSSTRVERGQISARDALHEYSALVAKGEAIRDPRSPEKLALAKEAGAVFCAELKAREDAWMGMPLQSAIAAADVTDAAIGTLAGTLVLQRNLPQLLLKYPLLNSLFSDFSDGEGLWQQTELTRILVSPAVLEYNGALDANGRPIGAAVAVPAQTVDVPITLSKHPVIPMVFGVHTVASTIRNLFAEQQAGAINALGGYFVNMATALMTAANFNAFAQITDAGAATTSGSTTVTLASTAGCYRGQEISGTGIPTGAVIVSVTDGA